ncbi:FAD-dependent oxidoreductase [Brachybacterium hainanense]|uniref:FAD-dependent oxidoreductase n=1 Tax=Brachybacterium hainanense TaxID=1541174 RepID=A0ABV6RC09_9MICO
MSDSVLIVGAGPTGLALAVHLVLHGVRVRIIDAASEPATTSRALGLQSRGVEVLERIGALGDLPKRSRSLLTLYYNEGPKTKLRLQVGRAVASLPKPTFLVSQAEVEGALRDRLSQLGATIEWGTRLAAADQDEADVTATLDVRSGTQRERFHWLVGCDGAHSAVRHLAGIDFPGTQLIDRLLMIDVRADWPYDPDGSVTWMDTGRMLSVTALPGGAWRVFSEPDPEVPGGLSEAQIAELVLGEFTRRSGLDAAAAGEVLWATEFRIHRRLAEKYRNGRIMIAGDAAHIQSPSGGQGQNTGLGDAENLGWKLGLVAAGRAGQQLLDSYDAERRPLAAKMLAATTGAVGIMLPDRRWKRFVRDFLVMPAMRIPAVQRRLWLVASQLTVTYRHGPLARSSSLFRRRPMQGDRMPDLECRLADGAQSTLHRALAGRWAVVAADLVVADRHRRVLAAQVGDDQVVALSSPNMRADLVVVRPDGHIGWRGGPESESLSPWLQQILRPA